MVSAEGCPKRVAAVDDLTAVITLLQFKTVVVSPTHCGLGSQRPTTILDDDKTKSGSERIPRSVSTVRVGLCAATRAQKLCGF